MRTTRNTALTGIPTTCWVELALTATESHRYFDDYAKAIDAIGATVEKNTQRIRRTQHLREKLSALHPRYEFAQHERAMRELAPKLRALAERANKYGMGLTVDVEESERLDSVAGYNRSGILFRRHSTNWQALVLRSRPISNAPSGVIRLADRAGKKREAPHPGARWLRARTGTARGEACPGTWAWRLSGVHPQAQHGHVLSGLRTQAIRYTRRALSHVLHL